jgi:hypothetical protein
LRERGSCIRVQLSPTFVIERNNLSPLHVNEIRYRSDGEVVSMGSIERLGFSLFLAFVFLAFTPAHLMRSQAAPGPGPTQNITLPAGTRIEAAIIRPLWANVAAPGSQLYGQTTFPVILGDRVAIPAGTYVEGTVEKLTRPTRRSNRASIEVLFTQIIFANGYVAPLPPMPVAPAGAVSTAMVDAPSLIDVTVQVSTSNDLFLDNGAPIDITLGSPLALNAQLTTAAAPLSHAPDPGQFKSTTRCRPIAGTPGTPGTPDTVIPGTPGTPDTVIPGGPGMPDTVIPGTPATPDTVIPGTPGTPGFPGRSCPAPPMVISSTPVNANLANNSLGKAQPPAAAH